MGCGCAAARSGAAQVHPKPESVVPTSPSSSSRLPSEPGDTVPPDPTPEQEVAAPQPSCTLEAASVEPAPPNRSRPKKTLVKAAKDNDLSLLDELLCSGANLEDVGMWDNTPLLAACAYGRAEAALRLINHRANVCAKNEHGATPMHYAAVEGLKDVVDALLESARSKGGDAEATKLVTCEHAKVYNRHLDAYAQRTPLCSAAESGFMEVASILIAAGAPLEDVDETEGRTPLWLAARHSRATCARLLIQHGANPSAKDVKGVSVLEAAVTSCSEELVCALLAEGTLDVNDTAGCPLRDAVRHGKRGVVEALLTHGASVELKPGSIGSMPLHAACEKGDEYFVSLLVRSRADPSVRDMAGLTAFDLLRRRGLPDGQIVQLLSPPGCGGGDGSTGATGDTADASPD